jgi:hypothetical protein
MRCSPALLVPCPHRLLGRFREFDLLTHRIDRGDVDGMIHAAGGDLNLSTLYAEHRATSMCSLICEALIMAIGMLSLGDVYGAGSPRTSRQVMHAVSAHHA